MKGSGPRKKLLGLILNLRELTCPLAVLDTPITLHERVSAWKEAVMEEVCTSSNMLSFQLRGLVLSNLLMIGDAGGAGEFPIPVCAAACLAWHPPRTREEA